MVGSTDHELLSGYWSVPAAENKRLSRLSDLIDRAELECSLRHLDHAVKFVSKARQVRDAIVHSWANQYAGEELRARFGRLNEALQTFETHLDGADA